MKFKNQILFDESAAEFVCEALNIKVPNPTDVVAIKNKKVVTKQDGLLALIDLEEDLEN